MSRGLIDLTKTHSQTSPNSLTQFMPASESPKLGDRRVVNEAIQIYCTCTDKCRGGKWVSASSIKRHRRGRCAVDSEASKDFAPIATFSPVFELFLKSKAAEIVCL